MVDCIKCVHFKVCQSCGILTGRLTSCPNYQAEVVHGTWLDWHGNPVSPDAFYRWWRCSECKYQYVFDEAVKREHFPSNYCPNCGAKMDGDVNA